MRKFCLLLALMVSPILAKAGEITISYLTPPAVSASPSVEIIGSTVEVDNTVKSATLTFTSDAATSMIAALIEYRHSNGQTITQMTLDGAAMTISTAATGYQLYAGIYTFSSPSVGSHNITITLSATTAAISLSALGFSNVTTVGAKDFNGTQNVATSSTTNNIAHNAGDILTSFIVTQDSTTAQSTMNTAAAITKNSWAINSFTGNTDASGWAAVATYITDAGNDQINFSRAVAANTSNVWTVFGP